MDENYSRRIYLRFKIFGEAHVWNGITRPRRVRLGKDKVVPVL
jgi:hypothetical protein